LPSFLNGNGLPHLHLWKNSRAYHNAIDDIMGEGVVITAYARFISQFDDLYEDEKSEA
jgi:hypothetical protein